MIVQCDKCDAKFQLADDKIGEKGAKVRCSKCKSVFTVYKPKADGAQAPSPPKAPATPKAGPPAKAPAKPAGGGEDDPFSDFNFSDDLDFSEEPEAAAAPPKEESVAPEFDDTPGVSFSAPEPDPPPPPAPAPPSSGAKPAGGGGDGFDFSDEDFSFSDEPAAPADQPAAPAASGGGGGDFGNVSFGDDSFDAPAGGEAAGGGDPDEWGNVSMSDVTDEAERPEGADEFDDVGFGDFKFDADDKLPGKDVDEDDSMDVIDDFVRSPSSKAKVSDDLEASIGESEPEPERERKAPAPRSEESDTPPPPKPAVKREPSGPSPIGKILKIVAVLIVLLLAAGGGAIAFFKIPIDAVTSFNTEKIQNAIDEWMYETGRKERPLEGKPVIVSTEKSKIIRDDGSPALLIYGNVRNATNKRMKEIKIVAQLEGAETNQLYAEFCYCQTSFDAVQLKSSSKETLEANMHASLRELPPVERDATCPYMIVFVDLTEGVIFKSVEIQSFTPLPDIPQ